MQKAEWRTVYIATLATKNFYFEGFGAGEAGEAAARIALNLALQKHARQLDLSDGWYDEAEIQVRDVQLGWPYRDGELMR